MFRLLGAAISLVIIHTGCKAFWALWVPLLGDQRLLMPHLSALTYGELTSELNRSVVAPIAQSWLDLAARAPLWPEHAVAFARWLIGG